MTYSDRRNDGRELPAYIYRRRRVAAVVLLIVLIAAVVLVVRCAAGGGDGERTAATGASRESITEERPEGESVTAAPGGSEEPSASESAEETAPYAVPSPPPETVDKDTCELADLRLTVQSDQPSYSGDHQPTFSLIVYNPTNADCVVDLEANKVRFETYAMADYARVWSDVDCHESEGRGTVTVPPRGEVVYESTWGLRTSAPGRCSEQERVPAERGPHLVYGLLGDRNSEASTFNLL
ncbi:hypothetical protein [Corynebacterium sp. 335C]